MLIAAAKAAGTSIQWVTLAWIGGAIIVAAVIITAIVLVSRKPKSMEDRMDEFARSLQAVAPTHRPAPRQGGGQPSAGPGKLQEQGPARRGEAEPV